MQVPENASTHLQGSKMQGVKMQCKNISKFYAFFKFGDKSKTLLCIFMRFNIIPTCYRRSYDVHQLLTW